MILLSLLTLLYGALLTLSFAPFHVYSAAFIAPALLLFTFLRSTPKQSLWLGWLFGLGFFGTGASWIYVSIHNFGNASVFLASLITFLFVAFLALYPATLGYIFRKCFSRLSKPIQCFLVFPILWTAWEVLRSVLFTGFPWILLGYSQLDTPLRGLAPIIGVYGLSFITTMISGALVILFKKSSRASGFISLIIIFGWIGLGFAFEHHHWTKPIGTPIEVSLIQGNIPQEIKWNPDFVTENINVYKELTFEHFDSKLIVWPEGAMPVYANDAALFIKQLGQLAERHHSNIIFGVPIKNGNKAYNALLMIGDNHGQYLKSHLVPFGEYIPLNRISEKVMSYFNIPMSDFSSGPTTQPPLTIQHVRIAPFICYEIAFQHQVLAAAKHNNMLLTISDDSWFGKSIALAQHLQMAQMRSLETGRPQLLDTNTGITAFISSKGKIEQSTPIDKRIVLTKDVQPMEGETPLMRWE